MVDSLVPPLAGTRSRGNEHGQGKEDNPSSTAAASTHHPAGTSGAISHCPPDTTLPTSSTGCGTSAATSCLCPWEFLGPGPWECCIAGNHQRQAAGQGWSPCLAFINTPINTPKLGDSLSVSSSNGAEVPSVSFLAQRTLWNSQNQWYQPAQLCLLCRLCRR